MQNTKQTIKKKYDRKFFENVIPTRLTEGRRIKSSTESWGLLYDYYLESVKVTWLKTGEVQSTATLKVSDRSGRAVCFIRGPTVGKLFGMSPQHWNDVEKLCGSREQLFYRYFKNGVNPHCRFEQRLFYNFCLSNQKTDLFVVVFKRGVNMRSRDASDPFLEILELEKCDNFILDLYVNNLRNDEDISNKIKVNRHILAT